MNDSDFSPDGEFEPHRMRISVAGPPDNSDWNTDVSADRQQETASGDGQHPDDPDDLNDPWSMLILAPPDRRR